MGKKKLAPERSTASSIRLQEPSNSYRLIDISRCIAIGSISESTYLRMVRAGVMPRPTKIGRINRWVELEVVAAFQRLSHGGDL